MPYVEYVNEAMAALARQFERRLASLSSSAGIIFANVVAKPSHEGGTGAFEVRLGMTKRIGSGAAAPLVREVFEKEIEEGFTFSVISMEGSSGAARDSNPSRPGEAQA